MRINKKYIKYERYNITSYATSRVNEVRRAFIYKFYNVCIVNINCSINATGTLFNNLPQELSPLDITNLTCLTNEKSDNTARVFVMNNDIGIEKVPTGDLIYINGVYITKN